MISVPPLVAPVIIIIPRPAPCKSPQKSAARILSPVYSIGRRAVKSSAVESKTVTHSVLATSFLPRKIHMRISSGILSIRFTVPTGKSKRWLSITATPVIPLCAMELGIEKQLTPNEYRMQPTSHIPLFLSSSIALLLFINNISVIRGTLCHRVL